MKRSRWGLIIILTLAVAFTGINSNVHATEPEGDAAEEETPEKKAEREAYEMPVQTNEIKNWPKGPSTYGEAGIVMDAGTGAILYAKNIDEHEYPASITKVLTALVALENGEMTDPVTFSHDCVSFLQPGDSSVGLKEGDAITLEQALYATLLASANEAAYAVAENVGKNAGHDYSWFLEQMNTRCRELGGENSNFANANGLHDPNHYTCARDMALIGRELFKHPEFFHIVQTLNYTIPATGTCEEHVFQQKHKMLIPGNSNYYECAVGGKTGYTSDALSTLITMAEKDGKQLVCVVLRTHGANIYPDTRNLLDYAFDNFKKVEVDGLEKSDDVGAILDEEEGGYVMLPDGVEFKDLDMKLVPDEGAVKEATLIYSYEGYTVGTARAKLSKAYIKEHSASIKKEASGDKKKSSGMSLKKKIFVGAAAVAGILLLAAYIWKRIERKRRRDRKRKRRRRRRR